MSHPTSTRSVEILLVEDNPGDIRLTQEALKEGGFAYQLRIARDGVEAMTILHREGENANAPLPDLILLDLNLPRKDGREVLAEIKSDDELKRIPVVILTTSEAAKDVQKVYALHANCYIIKPVNLDNFIETIKSIESFWLNTVKLPARNAGE